MRQRASKAQNTAFQKWIAEICRDTGKLPSHIATESGLKPYIVNKALKGVTGLPAWPNIKKIADTFHKEIPRPLLPAHSLSSNIQIEETNVGADEMSTGDIEATDLAILQVLVDKYHDRGKVAQAVLGLESRAQNAKKGGNRRAR